MTSLIGKVGAAAVIAAIIGAATFAANGSGIVSAHSARSAAHAPAWCGSKKISLALLDGFGDNNWRLLVRGEAYNEALKCPSVTKYVYQNGHGNTQTAISQIKSVAAEGINAMVVFAAVPTSVTPTCNSYSP